MAIWQAQFSLKAIRYYLPMLQYLDEQQKITSSSMCITMTIVN